jgi:hypothetical protein
MLPPGRARLATSPLPIGSATNPMTMGIVVVACWAARAAGVVEAKITSTLRRTSSAASSGSRSYFPSADRTSMARFWPSTQPRSRSPCRNAAKRGVSRAGDRYPTRGTFDGGCAVAVRGATRWTRISATTRIAWDSIRHPTSALRNCFIGSAPLPGPSLPMWASPTNHASHPGAPSSLAQG